MFTLERRAGTAFSSSAPYRVVEEKLVEKVAAHINSAVHQRWRDGDGAFVWKNGTAVCLVC